MCSCFRSRWKYPLVVNVIETCGDLLGAGRNEAVHESVNPSGN